MNGEFRHCGVKYAKKFNKKIVISSLFCDNQSQKYMARILITGGAGFIGSHLVLHWIKNHPQDQILNLDLLTYAADLSYLKSVEKNPNYQFIKGDIRDKTFMKKVFAEFKPEGIIHLAAESHVDNSINDPKPFIESNMVGTYNLLEEARLLGVKRFHHVSTDEVYGALGPKGFFTEQTPYSPNSPYSASKAGSDHLVNAYHHTYKMDTVITNCSNNFGPHQHDEKLIPTVIRSALTHQKIPVYGKGENVRDWLFVTDHCRAIDEVFHKGKSGEKYLISARNEKKNLDLVKELCNLLNELSGQGPQGNYQNLISFVTDRPGHDFRYAIDPRKIELEIGWKSQSDFKTQLKETVLWYIKKYQGA